MNLSRFLLFVMPMILVACKSGDMETIGRLHSMKIEIKEERLEGGIEKAMESYERFLKETPESSSLKPEAIRRLADLKIEKEYGLLTEGEKAAGRISAGKQPAPEKGADPEGAPVHTAGALLEQSRATSHSGREAGGGGEISANPLPAPPSDSDEPLRDFEKRATRTWEPAAGMEESFEGVDDLERAGTLEAIELYRKLMEEYPLYERNDQVLYQMSRAYEELGRIDEAMEITARLVRDFPNSRYLDEVQFRRAEFFFSHKRYLDAEEAYSAIVNLGVGSSYYELALYKLGWTFYKQELYEEALHRFIALLDYKVSLGYDLSQTEDEIERKRLMDTFRVISLGFSWLGGADSVVDYFSRYGKRVYEDGIYRNLGEFYFDKRRYSDAAATFSAFVSRNPFHRESPHFHMRIVEIHMAGAFPSLVIDAKKTFARTYSLQSEYWRHFEPGSRPEVLDYLKINLTDLANHYHSLYQNPKKEKGGERAGNYREALHWYREFLVSFPMEVESPSVHHRLADLLLENRSFAEAAVEYEKTAYDYPRHEKSSTAGYAAVYALREHLREAAADDREGINREVVRISLKFADSFPEHEKAAIVLGAAADDLYAMEEYEQALVAAGRLIETFSGAEADVLRAAWLVVAHSSYELLRYAEAETAYMQVLGLLQSDDDERHVLIDNLAASIYKQGEMANLFDDHRSAADHFLRVGQLAPTSGIRPTAEYDAAAALILLENWEEAAAVLTDFRNTFPGHELQPEVTKKIAYVYKENGRLSLAAEEYERIEEESTDDEVRREALLVAAELHEKVENRVRALSAYRRYVENFPQPVELNLETRGKIAEILKERNDRENYLKELREIVAIEASSGPARTERTRHLAAKAALVLGEWSYDRFLEIRLVQPFEDNLRKKRDLMKAATQAFSGILEYEFGEFTAAATFYLAEIYAHFSEALMESERPRGLSDLELEEYELAIEEQAYPFEEKAIDVHVKNVELISVGIYNEWVDRSLQKLAVFLPARYAKPEAPSGLLRSPDIFTFEIPGSGPIPSAAGKQVVAEEPVESVESVEKSVMAGKQVEVEGEVEVEKAVEVKPEADRLMSAQTPAPYGSSPANPANPTDMADR